MSVPFVWILQIQGSIEKGIGSNPVQTEDLYLRGRYKIFHNRSFSLDKQSGGSMPGAPWLAKVTIASGSKLESGVSTTSTYVGKGSGKPKSTLENIDLKPPEPAVNPCVLLENSGAGSTKTAATFPAIVVVGRMRDVAAHAPFSE